jgi:hypothetical protein
LPHLKILRIKRVDGIMGGTSGDAVTDARGDGSVGGREGDGVYEGAV